MQKWIVSITAVVGFTCSVLIAHSANAAALFFDKVAVKTSSEATCLRFAGDVARNQGFKNMHKGPAEVAGEKGGAYVAITCVGRGQQPAVAVVMSVSDSFDTAKQVGRFVADRMTRIGCIDTPC